MARGRIVRAFDQTVLERADLQAFDQTVRGQAGQRDRARADLIDPAQADLTDLVAGQNALERAGPSDQEIGPSGLTLPARTSRRASRTPSRTSGRAS